MKKILLLFLIFPLLIFGNMAKPYMDGSQHSVLFGGDASVKREIIDIRIIKEPVDKIHFANYTIKYFIHSSQKQKLPLLFIAIGLSGEQEVKVNHQATKIEPLDLEKKTYPFLKKNVMGTFVKYDIANELPINQDDLIYFSADLDEGKNIIEVKYDAQMEFNTYGFIKNYKLEYSLFPSKYWKSFGPIEVNLDLNNQVEFEESNLGQQKQSNNILKWTITPQNRDKIEIKLSEKTSFISKILLAIDPFGLAIISFIAMFFAHLKLMKKNLNKWTLILGIILVPILFYVFYFLSYDLINFTLGKSHTKHGYIFFIIVTYPILLLFYGIVMWQIYKRRKTKQSIENSVK